MRRTTWQPFSRLICLLLLLLLSLVLSARDKPKRNGNRQKQKPRAGGAWPRLPKIQWASVQRVLHKARDTVGHAATSLDDFLFGEPCPFVDDPAGAVRKALDLRIRAQPLAARAVAGHIKGWYGTDKPLVLAFTGPTGVGKTEMAHVVAEALLAKRKRVGRRGRTEPKGLLIFRGEDFAVDGSPDLLTSYHNRIKTQLAELLRTCDNRAVVVFDEAQKIAPGTLDVLLEAMSERPRLTVFSGYSGGNGVGQGGNGRHGADGGRYSSMGSSRDGGKTEVFDTSKIVFILISDIGKEEMFELIVKNNGRENTPRQIIETKIRSVLQAQWDRLAFNRAVDGSVPFLPLEEEHIREVLELKLAELNQRGQTYKHWAELQWGTALVERLSGRDFIKCSRLYYDYDEEEGAGGEEEDEEDEEEDVVGDDGSGDGNMRIFAKYGARGVVTDGPVQKIREMLAEHVPKDPNAIVRMVAIGTMSVRVECCTYQAPEQHGGEGGGGARQDACDEGEGPLNCHTAWEGEFAALQTY